LEFYQLLFLGDQILLLNMIGRMKKTS